MIDFPEELWYLFVLPEPNKEENTMSVIEELWKEMNVPTSQPVYLSDEIKEATLMTADAEEVLDELLSDKAKRIFADYCKCREELEILTDRATFDRGFRLGAKIMMEILRE